MKNKAVLTLLLLVSLLQAQEQKQTYSFSLQQAIEHALQHNYAAINANRDIDAAKQKKWETTAAGLPQISGNVSYLNNFDFTLQGISGNAFNPAASPDDISLVAFGTKQSMNSNLTLSQLLFDGSYIVALQASKTYLKYYENAKQKSNTEIREMVINSYGNVLLAQESIAILEKNKTTLSKTLSDTKETYKNGLIEEENVEQLQITLASIESNLNNTKRLLDVANKMLKFTLGIDLNSDLTLTDPLDSLTLSNLDLAFSQSGFEVTNNINYQMASNFQEQRSLELKLQRSKALPTLAAAVNFGYNSFANDFSFADSTQKWNKFSNLGVSLSVPIFSSFGRSAKTQQAKIAFEQAKTQLTQTEQQLKLQYEKAKSDYEFSIEEYATSKSNLNLAERIEKKQQIKFTEGLSSSFDFSEAQRQLYTAQQNYLQSMVNIINKKAALEKIINKN
jgi:outer membrane protein